jgi:hypothetical protein
MPAPGSGKIGTNAASSPFPPNGVSHLAATDGAVFRQQREGVSWPRATFCIVDQDPRALHGPSDQAGPGIPPGERRWDYEASSEAGSWAARADGAAIWARDSRSEQLARRERVQASSPLALPFISWLASTESRSKRESAEGSKLIERRTLTPTPPAGRPWSGPPEFHRHPKVA